MPADLIITNARILTMDPARPRAEAIAVADDRILAVGARDEIEALADAGTRIIDAGGRSLLPGFVESHLHLFWGGAELDQLQLTGIEGMDALKRVVADFAAAHPDRDWIIAQGGNYDMLDHPMTRHDLDLMLADRPFCIGAPDHHTVWANTCALALAGLLHGREMPPGHEVVMGPDGLASGELLEFEAYSPAYACAGEARIYVGVATGGEPSPEPSAEDRAADRVKLSRGLRHCAAHGITSMVNMDGNSYTLSLLRELQRERGLLARVKVPFHFKPHMDLSELDRADAMTRDFADDWLRSGFVKMFMDGVVDSRTAYMLDPYPGTDTRAAPLFSPAQFDAICIEADRRGLQIAVHAIGDAAVRQTIDGYEAAARANGPRDSRHRIEHIELIERSDIARLAGLGITASLQPPHPPGAMDFPLSSMEHVFHRDRWRDAYLVRTLAETGVPLAFASDWPVTDVSVMRGIQAALTRKPFEGCRDERLGLHEVLHAYTAGGARAAHLDDLTGTLRPGLAADIVVIDGDIETIPAAEIGRTGIAMTVAGGIVTHQMRGFA